MMCRVYGRQSQSSRQYEHEFTVRVNRLHVILVGSHHGFVEESDQTRFPCPKGGRKNAPLKTGNALRYDNNL